MARSRNGHDLKPGDVVLIEVPYTNLSGSKTRPALVMGSVGSDIVITALTSQRRDTPVAVHDYPIPNWQEWGLNGPGIVRTGKVMALDSAAAIRIGRAPEAEFEVVRQHTGRILGMAPTEQLQTTVQAISALSQELQAWRDVAGGRLADRPATPEALGETLDKIARAFRETQTQLNQVLESQRQEPHRLNIGRDR